MSPVDARVVQLLAEIERDWQHVVAHLTKAIDSDPRRSEADAALVALSLDHAYQAFETLLLRLERALGLPDRTGATWHSALLADAAHPLSALRPAVYPAEVEHDWQALLRFRHFLRHAYGVPLAADELARNRSHLEHAVGATGPLVRALIDALQA